MALGNDRRAMSIIDDERSRVISLTLLRLTGDIFSRTAMTVSAFVPRIAATSVPLSSVCITVGDEGIELATAERRLVDGQIRPDVLRIEDIFISMSQLLPLPVTAEYFLVLS